MKRTIAKLLVVSFFFSQLPVNLVQAAEQRDLFSPPKEPSAMASVINDIYEEQHAQITDSWKAFQAALQMAQQVQATVAAKDPLPVAPPPHPVTKEKPLDYQKTDPELLKVEKKWDYQKTDLMSLIVLEMLDKK